MEKVLESKFRDGKGLEDYILSKIGPNQGIGNELQKFAKPEDSPVAKYNFANTKLPPASNFKEGTPERDVAILYEG